MRSLRRAKRGLLKKFGEREWFLGVGIVPTDAGLCLRLNVDPDVEIEEHEIPATYHNIPIEILQTKGYAPRYFDSVYEAQRVQYGPGVTQPGPGDPVPLTKLGWLRQNKSSLGPHGWLGEIYFDFAGWVQVGGTLHRKRLQCPLPPC